MHGVCCLPRLADKDTHVIPEDGGASVQQVAGQLQIDWQVCEALHGLTTGQASMEGCAARDKDHAAAPPDAAQMVTQASQGDAAGLVRVHHLGQAKGQVAIQTFAVLFQLLKKKKSLRLFKYNLPLRNIVFDLCMGNMRHPCRVKHQACFLFNR